MNAIEDLKKLMGNTLEKFNTRYAEQLHSMVPLVNEINEYLQARSGKQIRPLLLLASAEAGLVNQPQSRREELMEEKIQLAIAMEILHNSSLMHDDVVDESAVRRGQETVRQKWSNKIAVLCGDYYLAQVMDILNRIHNTPISHIVDRTVIEMSEGELLQQYISRTYDQSLENYCSVIYKKTASLMSACCEIGYASLKTYGEEFGMAFQIRDDILDYHDEKETGKPCGNDIKEHKMTLPLLCYLKQASQQEQQRIKDLFSNEVITDQTAAELVAQVTHTNALHQAHEILRQRIASARNNLTEIQDSPYKEALYNLAGSLILE